MIKFHTFMFLMLTMLISVTETAFAINQDSLNEVDILFQTAIKAAEESLGPHQPGSGWTKQHMPSVINILEGNQGADFKINDASPKEGEKGVIPFLLKSQENLKKSKSSPQVNQAIDGALFFAQQAAEQAKISLNAKTIDETHHYARMAAGMLVAAKGLSITESPVTGNLEYMLRHSK